MISAMVAIVKFVADWPGAPRPVLRGATPWPVFWCWDWNSSSPRRASTAISPSFEEIGKLAAIAAIRTALNYSSTARSPRSSAKSNCAPSGAGARFPAGVVTAIIAASWCLAIAGIALGAAALVVFEPAAAGVRVTLEFLTAAGLLRLSATRHGRRSPGRVLIVLRR